MNLTEVIEEFRQMIKELVDRLEEIDSVSQGIPSTEAEQLSNKFAALMDNLEEVNSRLNTSTELLEEIRDRWG